MKSFYLFVFNFCICFFIYSQEYIKKDLNIEPYFGFPNWTSKSIASARIVDLDYNFNNLKYKDYGVYGIKLNYFLADNKSLGLDFFIKGYQLNGEYIYDSTFNEKTNLYDKHSALFTYAENRVRVHVRYNVYKNYDHSKFQTYWGFGLGYNGNFSFLTTKIPNEDKDIKEKIQKANSTKIKSFNSAILPFSMRVCYGVTYHINEYIGLNSEFGIGGSTFLIGLSFRY